MGKTLIQQARGKGSPTYKSPSFNYKGAALLPTKHKAAEVVSLLTCRGHSAPLAEIKFENNKKGLIIASEGLQVGAKIAFGEEAKPVPGNTLHLKDLSEGIPLYNIEGVPGDGGKFVRSSGTFARIVSKSKNKIIVLLPSKKQKAFHPDCRATIGVVAGGGRKEKPLVKAGSAFYKMRAKNKLYPKIRGAAQNAVDHPFGNKRTSRKSKARPVPRNAPPGRKVGYIRPKRTGPSKGRRKKQDQTKAKK